MNFQFSLRTKLYVSTAGAVAVLLLMAAVTFFSNRASVEALGVVIENNVKPLLILQEIDSQLKEVRFRAAGVLLDQMPAPGSRQHAKEVRGRLPQLWGDYARLAMIDAATENEEREVTEKLAKGFATLPALLEKLERAYGSADDKKQLESILEDDWPLVTTQVIKPMAQLIQIRNADVAKVYQGRRALGEKLNLGSIAIAGLAFAVMLLFSTLMVRGITRSVSEFQGALKEVADGNLAAHARVVGRDEIAGMAGFLNHTLVQLRDAMAGIHGAAGKLDATSRELSAEVQGVRTRADLQTSDVMKISGAMQQMTVSVAEIAVGAGKVSEAAGRAMRFAEDGVQVMTVSQQATERVLDAASRSTQAVDDLSSSIVRISDIARVISDIAGQTNLLALNAAIESARAGEAGRGFAVVADEVRKLAERTTRSTSDIADMVGAIQAQADAAVKAMQEVDRDVQEDAENIGRLNSALQQIMNAARDVTGLADEIATATREQRQAAEQTSRSMESISQTIESTGASITKVAGTATDTATTASALQSLVGRFRFA